MTVDHVSWFMSALDAVMETIDFTLNVRLARPTVMFQSPLISSVFISVFLVCLIRRRRDGKSIVAAV